MCITQTRLKYITCPLGTAVDAAIPKKLVHLDPEKARSRMTSTSSACMQHVITESVCIHAHSGKIRNANSGHAYICEPKGGFQAM